MSNDLKLIKELTEILTKKDDEPAVFLRTDLAAIIPDGSLSAYSLNDNGCVDGLKIADIGAYQFKNIFDIILRFIYLERLVFYLAGTKAAHELPSEIGNLYYLKYIALRGFSKLPEELFNLDLKMTASYRLPRHLDSHANENDKHVLQRIELFRSYNPNINFEVSPDMLKSPIRVAAAESVKIKALNEFMKDFHGEMAREMDIFCKLDDESTKSVLSDNCIFISDIKEIQDPPYEIVEQGTEAILKYFKEKDIQGSERLFEAKIVIVGAGESGKTTLIRKLKDPNHPVPNAEDKRTEGIRVTTYPFKGLTKYGEKSIRAHVWDFGGQELYHTTHQLFLTPDTLYILLNDNRKNDTDFYYWLNIVTIRAGNSSPILMIFNAKDNAARQIIPGEELYDTFPNLIKKSIDVNFADKNLSAILNMKQIIERHFTGLEVLGKPFPAYWVKVRDALTKLPVEHIGWLQFNKICEKNGISDNAQIQILATTLHNLGVILYFPEVFGLNDLIILKPQWCVDAIYSALDIKNIADNGGRFNENTLAKRWSGKRFAGNHLQLLKLMQHFDLCYKVEGSSDYIAPQLLPIEENRLPMPNRGWAIVFQFDYIFMPAGLITRLIARMSPFIKSPYAWRAGVVLEWEEGTIAEIIEHQLTHKIVIKINGPERKRRLLEIRKCLCDLQKDFKGLKFKQGVSCNCADCSKGGEVTIFNIAELEEDAVLEEDVLCRNGTRKKIPAKNVLEGIDFEDKPRIFISYSHQNEDFKKEFRTMIAPMEKGGHWKVWDDRWLLPGDRWNTEIAKHLNEANVIVLMLTPKFFDSSFIYDIELPRAIQRHEEGEALIIGVIVSDCMWEDTPLAKIQMLPVDGLPVERHQHRSEVWKAVATKIKETILVRQRKGNRTGGWNG